MAYTSAPEDLALRRIRVLGFATAARIAGRYIVWIQFHEDLLATLGMPRGSDI